MKEKAQILLILAAIFVIMSLFVMKTFSGIHI